MSDPLNPRPRRRRLRHAHRHVISWAGWTRISTWLVILALSIAVGTAAYSITTSNDANRTATTAAQALAQQAKQIADQSKQIADQAQRLAQSAVSGEQLKKAGCDLIAVGADPDPAPTTERGVEQQQKWAALGRVIGCPLPGPAAR